MHAEWARPTLRRASLLLALLAITGNGLAYAEEERAFPLTDMYSEMDTRLRLAIKADAEVCDSVLCEQYQEFDDRIAALGEALIAAAILAFPERQPRLQKFEFSVVEKRDAGVASNSRGKVMLFRGLQEMQLSDDALAFIMSREMGHILAGHHRTNTSTKLMISALASIIFPAAAVVAASSTAAQASTATTLITSAASTATSVIGGEVAVSSMKPAQLSESVEIAVQIMQRGEWDIRSANSVLLRDDPPQNEWWQDLEHSRYQLEAHIHREEDAIISLHQNLAERRRDF